MRRLPRIGLDGRCRGGAFGRPGAGGLPRGHRRRQLLAFTRRSLRQYTRSPLSLLFLVAWPAFWYVLVSHLLFTQPGGGTGRIAAAKAALAVSFGLFGALTVAMTGVVGAFTADIQAKRYRKFRSLAVTPMADVVGRFLAGGGLSLVAYAGLLVVGALDGAAFAMRAPWTPLVVVISVVTFAAVGVAAAVAIAALVPRPEHATLLATALLLLGFFGTGFNGVSPGLFVGPPWLLNVIPVTAITRLQLFHLVDPSAVSPGVFGPPPLPSGPDAVGLTLAAGAGSLVFGAMVVDLTVYRWEAGE